MLRGTGDTVQFRNAAMADGGASPSYSSSFSTTSSSDSEPGAGGEGARRFDRPGLQRLTLREMMELEQMRRDAARNAAHQGEAQAPPNASSRGQESLQPVQAAQAHGFSNVAFRQANCRPGPWIKAIFVSLAALCATLACLGLTYWIRLWHRDFSVVNFGQSRADHVSLPFFSSCDTETCHKYTTTIESSINRSQDPCTNFYRFVCDGWKQHHQLLSVIDVVEDAMYDRALSAVESVAQGLSNHENAPSPASSVQKEVAVLVTSCIKLSESSLGRLKSFMAQHYLPWPETSHKDLLDIMLDLSGNYNFHLWFQISLELSHHRSRRGEPLLKIGPSHGLRVWIALMRTFGSLERGTTPSLVYRMFVRNMLRLFGVPESRDDELLATIEAMNRLILAVIGPAIANSEQRTLRMPFRNFTDALTPRISASRWVPLLNRYFIWAGRFSAETTLEVENPDLFRAVAYLLRLKTEVQEAMTLSLGLRVVTEIGWMADREIAKGTLELMGLPSSAHTRRCLVQVESSVGVAWLSLFSEHRGAEDLVKDVRDALVDVAMRNTSPSFGLRARVDATQLENESFFAKALPNTTSGPTFFSIWMDLMNSRWQLQYPSLANVLKPGSATGQRWSLHGALTTSDEYFLFPLFHPDLPLAVIYGGAGRLIADEVLRGLYYEPLASDKRLYITHPNEGAPTQPQPEWYPHNVDTEALMTALKAYRLGFLRHSASSHFRGPTLEEDRLFFVASCYALCSTGDHVGELYGDASRRCNVPVTTLSEFRAAFQCDALNDLN